MKIRTGLILLTVLLLSGCKESCGVNRRGEFDGNKVCQCIYQKKKKFKYHDPGTVCLIEMSKESDYLRCFLEGTQGKVPDCDLDSLIEYQLSLSDYVNLNCHDQFFNLD